MKQFASRTRHNQVDRVPNAYNALKSLPEASEVTLLGAVKQNSIYAQAETPIIEAVRQGLGPNYIVEISVPRQRL